MTGPLGEWGRRLRYLWRRRLETVALREELRAHREALGSPARFGNVRRLEEEADDVWGWRWFDDAARDLRLGLRGLRRQPGHALVVVASIALAAGAMTAVCAVVDAVLMRPLPFGDPAALVQVHGRVWTTDSGQPDPVDGPVSPEALDAYLAGATSLRAAAGYAVGVVHLNGPEGPERATAVRADAALFDVLDVPAAVGRTFRPGDPGDAVVVSDALWARRWQRAPSVPGRRVIVDGAPATVIGVMPALFRFPYRAASTIVGVRPGTLTDVWRQLPPRRQDGVLRRGRLDVVARLAPGATAASAATELRAIDARLTREATGGRRYDARVVPLATAVAGPVGAVLWWMAAGGVLVLVAACVNVANLGVGRALTRVRELVTCTALGATRSRLARQVLIEGATLALAGGVAGAGLAWWTVGVVAARGGPYLPRVSDLRLDGVAFLVQGVAVAATTVATVLAPLWVLRAVRPAALLSGGRVTTSRGAARVRDGLVVVEVAMAALLAGAAIAVAAETSRLTARPLGFDPGPVLTMHVAPRATPATYAALAARVSALPGIRAAGFIQLLPLQHWGWEGSVERPDRPRTDRLAAELRYVTPGYFAAMGIPLRAGRLFDERDGADAPPVVVVNDVLAARVFGGDDPIGARTDRGVVIGVVGSVRQTTVDRPPAPEVYYTVAQNLSTVSEAGMTLVARVDGDPVRLVATVRDAVRSVDPDLAVFSEKPMTEVVGDALASMRLARTLTVWLAGLAVALAAIGLSGVLAFHAASRRREFAVRLAIGAAPARVLRLVLGRGVRLAAVGLSTAVAAVLVVLPAAGRTWPIAMDGRSIGAAAVGLAVLIGGLTAASSLPAAVRSSRVDPAAALRHE